MNTLPWLILFLPLASAAIIALFIRSKRASGLISIGAIVASFLMTLAVMSQMGMEDHLGLSKSWLSVGTLQIDFGIWIDHLSLIMLLVVTGVGSVIHIYSYGYMHDEPAFFRYFASLSLFSFSMLGIVLSNNFIQMFIFWELVGVSSYLLIGFWYERTAAADAAKKAFLTNRLGDFGFLLGILLLWATVGDLNFNTLQKTIWTRPEILGPSATAIGLLIFCGAAGKSAQFPLHVWLPDAMEGPTPVSALIHAATMVAAGVYMLSRTFFLFDPHALVVISWIGGITALLAALIAVQQNDIKRILAYSTLSQLGYMVMAVGLKSPSAGMFHLVSHAFFKALLFLGAGAVIYALHHEQNIWKMGGLRKRMPITYWTFTLATLALCGVPPLSGFFSKDEILATASHESLPLFFVATGVAFLTTFYMFRLWFVAFAGKSRSESAEHAHEVPTVMHAPLVILAVLTIFGGMIGIDRFIGEYFSGPELEHGFLQSLLAPFENPLAAFFGLLAVGAGLSISMMLYANATHDRLTAMMPMLCQAMKQRFYFDEIYQFFIKITHEAIASLASAIDRWILGGLVIRGGQGSVELFGRALRMVQTGSIQTYAFLFVASLCIVIFIILFR